MNTDSEEVESVGLSASNNIIRGMMKTTEKQKEYLKKYRQQNKEKLNEYQSLEEEYIQERQAFLESKMV